MRYKVIFQLFDSVDNGAIGQSRRTIDFDEGLFEDRSLPLSSFRLRRRRCLILGQRNNDGFLTPGSAGVVVFESDAPRIDFLVTVVASVIVAVRDELLIERHFVEARDAFVERRNVLRRVGRWIVENRFGEPDSTKNRVRVHTV